MEEGAELITVVKTNLMEEETCKPTFEEVRHSVSE